MGYNTVPRKYNCVISFYTWMRPVFIDKYGIFPQVEDVAYEIVQ